MTTTAAPGAQLPEPLATDAATAATAAGPCCLCERGILRAERYARLTSSGRLAHVPCIATMAGTTTRRAA